MGRTLPEGLMNEDEISALKVRACLGCTQAKVEMRWRARWCVGSGRRAVGKKDAPVGKRVGIELKLRPISVKIGGKAVNTIWLMSLIVWDSSKSLF